jgi:hypothetical protein
VLSSFCKIISSMINPPPLPGAGPSLGTALRGLEIWTG